ncbi:MAG: hypothetical protein WAN10_17375 [Candidatus Acidiferrales bacterium]
MKVLSGGRIKATRIAVMVVLGGGLLAFGLAPTASANTYTYTYTGNPLSSCSGPGCVASAPYPVITGSFTVSSPLGANLSYGPVSFLSYSITDGTSVLTNLNSTLEGPLDIETVAGVITEWYFFAEQLGGSSYTEIYTTNIPPSSPSYCCPEDASLDQESYSPPFTPVVNNANFFDAGTWAETSSTTPEAPTLVLLGTGLLALGAAVLRGKQIA